MKKSFKLLLISCIALALIFTTYQPSNFSKDTTAHAKGWFKPKPTPKPTPKKPKPKPEATVSPVSKKDAVKALELIGTKGKGTKAARKFLKKKLAKASKDKRYIIKWNVKSKDKKHLKSLVVVLQKKKSGKRPRAFAVDYHSIPLKPKSQKAIWHFHSGSGSTHYTLYRFIPKGHTPDSQTVVYASSGIK